MSVQAIAWVLEHSESRLGARHVLISIANHAKADGTGAWPSITTIAHESRLSEREVQLSIRKLVAAGELCVEQGAGPHGTNLYSLPLVAARGEKFAPLRGEKPSTQGVKNPTSGGEKFSPEPSLIQPSLEPSGALPPTPLSETQEANQRDFSDRAIQMFRSRFKQKPTWSVRDYKQLADLRKVRPDLTLEEFARRYGIMLGAQDSFIEAKRGSLAYFCSHFDEFIEPIRRNGHGHDRTSWAEERERRTHENILRGVEKAFERAARTASGGIPDRTK
jgi:hypothetical protein